MRVILVLVTISVLVIHDPEDAIDDLRARVPVGAGDDICLQDLVILDVAMPVIHS